MAGSSWGTLLRMTTWGESHGSGLGAVVDGCPAGLPLCEEDIQRYLDRRRPGQSRYTTKRQEADRAEILSGVFEGKTTGTPISILVRNTDQRSRDYSATRITPSTRSTGFGTTGAAAVPPAGRPSDGWLPALWRRSFCRNWAWRSSPMPVP